MRTTIRTTNLFRAAIAAGDWTRADKILTEFRNDVEIAWRAASDEAEQLALKQHVQETLGWARNTIYAARSHDQRSLLRLVRGGAYTDVKPRAEIFELEG